MIGFILISCALLASSLSTALTYPLIRFLNLNFFTQGLQTHIPAFGPAEALLKTYDLVDFGLTIILFAILFAINYFATLKTKENKAVYIWYLVFSVIIFLQTHFVTFSGRSVLILIFLAQAAVVFILRREWRSTTNKGKVDYPLLVINGLLTGFYLMLVSSHLTTVVAIPLLILVSLPMIYTMVGSSYRHFTESHVHLLLILSLFLSNSQFILYFLGLVTLLLVIVFRDRFQNRIVRTILYPAATILVFTFNPLYYVGNFDTVEEGFWLGWLQRLINNQNLYRDVKVYHPPLIAWGMFYFGKVTSFSIANARLFLHLLQVAGLIIYYFVVSKLLNSVWSRLTAMILAISFTTSLVRNNAEIRLGMGLLPLLALAKYWETLKPKWLITSGMLAGLSIFVSLEVGIVSSLTLLVGIFFTGPKPLAKMVWTSLGACASIIPILLILLLQGSLADFISQLSYYAKAFSNGYFNLPIERSINLSFLHWHIVNQYLSSTPLMWELARLGMLVALGVAVWLLVKRSGGNKERLVILLSLFTFLIFRSALGRSDSYHLLFPLLLVVPLLFYVIESLSGQRKWLVGLFALFFVFVISRDVVNANFAEQAILRFQTFGKPLGDFNQVNSTRSGILVGKEIDTISTDSLIEYVDANTTPGDNIYVYPWSPEAYFLTNRINSTKFDTPYAFFTDKYQDETIQQLRENPPKLIIYNPDMKFANMTPESLPMINMYINENFTQTAQFGKDQIMLLNP